MAESIVNIAQGNNNSRAAIGWSSMGYLLDGCNRESTKKRFTPILRSVDLNPSFMSLPTITEAF